MTIEYYKDLILKNTQDKMIELFGEEAYIKYLEWKKFQHMQEMENYLIASIDFKALQGEEE